MKMKCKKQTELIFDSYHIAYSIIGTPIKSINFLRSYVRHVARF